VAITTANLQNSHYSVAQLIAYADSQQEQRQISVSQMTAVVEY